MARKHPDLRVLKDRRTYTVEELAMKLRVHENTVRAWHRAGLAPVDEDRPMLFRGDHVRTFLRQRRESARQPCGPGRLFCLRCRAPQSPAAGMLDYIPDSVFAGRLTALCPACGGWM